MNGPRRAAATIASIEASPLDVPLRKPFGIAGGAQEIARNAIVRLALDDGTVGWGEAAPFPAFNGETQEATLAAIASARAAIEGRARSDRAIGDVLRAMRGAARCAIETAILDADARARNVPIFPHGGRSLATDVTIPIGPAAECASDARAWAERGFARLKIKIGGEPIDAALARVLAVHEAAPRCALMLDGNAGFTAKDAIAIARDLAARGVRPILFEQPVAKDDLDGLAEVSRAIDFPVAADESASSVADVEELVRRRAVAVVNVKPMKNGFHEAIAIAEIAKREKLGLMIGGMVEGKMAMCASACLAAALEGFDYVDLDTPLFLARDPFEGGWAQDGERIDLSPITAGHGCVPRGIDAGR